MIDAQKLHSVFLDCLYRNEEIEANQNQIPEGTVLVEAIQATIGFHPDRLESHREEVRNMLSDLPLQFRKGIGGGWSFLNACNDKDGNLWTGEHKTVMELVALGIGLGLAGYCLPRSMWDALPGSMP